MSSKTGVIILVVLGLLVLLGSGAFYTVDQREVALLMHFGSPVDKIIKPGIHMKWPVVSTVRRYDTRLRVTSTVPITYLLKDRNPIVLEAYLCWRIVAPLPFYKDLQNADNAEEKLKEIASSVLKIRISQHPIEAMVSTEKGKVKLPEIEESLKKDVQDAITALSAGAVEIARAGIYRLALAGSTEEAVSDRMRSERETARTDYETQGEEQAKKMRAKADEEAQAIIAQAVEQERRIRGIGEAEATEIYRQAYSKDRDFYRFWRTLDSYKKIFGTETTLVIPADSEFMKYFRLSEAEKFLEPEKK